MIMNTKPPLYDLQMKFFESCAEFERQTGKIPTEVFVYSDKNLVGENACEIVALYNGMSDSMKVAVKKIMEVTQTIK